MRFFYDKQKKCMQPMANNKIFTIVCPSNKVYYLDYCYVNTCVYNCKKNVDIISKRDNDTVEAIL